jgi:hypothetical protein
MVFPIGDPQVKFEYLNEVLPSGFAPRVYEMSRKWSRQPPPYDLPSPFEYHLKRAYGFRKFSNELGPDEGYYADVLGIPSFMDVPQSTYNACFQKFREEIGERANFALMAVEGKQAVDMVTNRFVQLRNFSRYLRKGWFGLAAKELKVSLSSGKIKRLEGNTRKGASSFADNYLEFHFGWSPLVADIYGGVKTLCRPIPARTIRASVKYDHTDIIPTVVDGKDRIRAFQTDRQQTTLTMRGQVKVVNPNIALLEQCGLINPLTILWEKVPFSFVVDWFVNVGEVLANYTDFAGVSIENPHRTYFTEWSRNYTRNTTYNVAGPEYGSAPGPDPSYQRYEYSEQYNQKLVSVRRIVGTIPGPKLSARGPWTLSTRRGLAAASLLIQSLKGK